LYVCRHAIRALPLLVTCLLPWSAQAEPPAPPSPSAALYRGLPLIFEANAGQMDPVVKFFSRGPGYTLFLTPTEAALALIKSSADANPPKGTLLRMKLVGANPQPPVSGQDALPGKVNYFIGDDPKKWRTNVPTYAKVKYESVYPGVDLVYYGDGRQLEYDFVVAPGSDPKAIALAFEGVDKLEVDAQGDLVLAVNGGEPRLRRPLVYQEVDGEAQARGRELRPQEQRTRRRPEALTAIEI
jgi:hypothetical protein